MRKTNKQRSYSVLEIFEDQYKKGIPLTVVKPVVKREGLLIFLILLKYAMMLGKLTNVHIIVFQIKNLTLF